MSPAQNKRYWRIWGDVRKALTELGDFSKSDADAERKAITLEALGEDKSSKDLTNADLDKIFDAFDKILVIFNGPGDHDRAARQPVARLIYAIDQLGLDAPYIEAICLDSEFKTTAWRNLNERQLTRFRYTLTRAARALKRQASGSN
jgi:hypothetical protein